MHIFHYLLSLSLFLFPFIHSIVMAAPFRMPAPVSLCFSLIQFLFLLFLQFMFGGASMMYIGGGVGGRASHRYPNKQSLKWTPNKHLR